MPFWQSLSMSIQTTPLSKVISFWKRESNNRTTFCPLMKNSHDLGTWDQILAQKKVQPVATR